MFVTGALIHLPTRSRVRTPVAQQATAWAAPSRWSRSSAARTPSERRRA